MADDERPEWCLICSQRPAEGTMRRVFASSRSPVVTDQRVPQPRVCQGCADEHHGTPAAKAPNGRPTMWEFELTDPAPRTDTSSTDEVEHEQ